MATVSAAGPGVGGTVVVVVGGAVVVVDVAVEVVLASVVDVGSVEVDRSVADDPEDPHAAGPATSATAPRATSTRRRIAPSTVRHATDARSPAPSAP